MSKVLCTCLICHWFFLCDAENCPDHNPSLSSWNPGHQPQKAVVVRTGQLLRLESSATFLSLTIQSGGEHVRLYDSVVCSSVVSAVSESSVSRVSSPPSFGILSPALHYCHIHLCKNQAKIQLDDYLSVFQIVEANMTSMKAGRRREFFFIIVMSF